ncbi:unnamed protein product [Acanthosepion pharaonis]|uniref:Uncharacterized protein n=1 Tax=Acanthosepion pharaonis TaxID=158019 RepID=A0A812EBX1_ACAPH|nr:unnamed protein product [Sepia pharaonis]
MEVQSEGAEAEYTVHLSNHNSSKQRPITVVQFKEQRPNIQCIVQIKQFMEVQRIVVVKFSSEATEAEYTVHLSNHNSSWKFSQKGAGADIQQCIFNITVHGSSVRRSRRPNIQCICQISSWNSVRRSRGRIYGALSNHNSSWKFSQKGAGAEYTVHLSNHNSSWKFSQKGAEAQI